MQIGELINRRSINLFLLHKTWLKGGYIVKDKKIPELKLLKIYIVLFFSFPMGAHHHNSDTSQLYTNENTIFNSPSNEEMPV